MQIRTAPKNIKKGEAVFDISEITETWALPYCKLQSLDHVFVEPKLSDLCQNCGKVMNSGGDSHTLNYSLLKEVLGFDFQIGSQFEYDSRFCSSKCFCKAQFMFGPILSSLKKIAPDLVSFWKKRLCVRIMDQDDVSILVATCMFWNFSQHFNFISKIHHESTRQSFNKTIDEALYEYWMILYSALPSISDSDDSTLFNVDVFDSIVKAIRRRCFLTQSDVYRLSNVVDALFKSTSNLNVKIDTVLSEFNRCLNGFSALYEKSLTQVISTELAAWRAISRVSQGITETIENDTDFSNELNDELLETLRNFSPRFTIIIPYLEFTHSCIPNGFIEKREDKVVLIALHDIFLGEQITVSLIDNLEADVTTRELLLRNIYEKDFQCMCFRCNIERIDINKLDEAIGAHKWYEWKRMGDLSMQYSRFPHALKYYDIALLSSNLQSSNLSDTERGDILHARAATFLGRRQFIKACEAWNDAYSKVSSHTGIKLQVTKTISYKDPGNGCSTSQGSTYSYETLIPSKCFMTKDAVVTNLECKQAIQWAEEASVYLPGGWTTSRHYAVPTTDIPVHQIPKLLSWFKHVFYTRFRPLLGQQFGKKEVGEYGSAVYIHDAFIVRYDSQGGQRHLPLHRDESTHSFTIALNSLDEYEGGGTYISQLQKSLKPEQGGAVSFRGSDLLHGGDPVIRGTRYIIVAFCYADFAGLDKEQDQTVKKQKLENCSTNFSFGFQF